MRRIRPASSFVVVVERERDRKPRPVNWLTLFAVHTV